MKRLEGRVAAITGAASGIGRATACALAAAGCDLALADVDEEGLAQTGRLAAEHGTGISIQTVDVANREQMAGWAQAVAEAHGGAQILVNNAGVALSQSAVKMQIEDVEWLFGINWWGMVYGTHYFLPQLRAFDESHIVNLSSLFGFIGVPTQSAYCAAKFAVRGFTETLRMELAGSGIGVSCVHPGGIATAIARNSRFTDGIGDLDREQSVAKFDRLARTSPRAAAKAIVAGIRKNRARVVIGADAKLLQTLPRAFPRRYGAAVGWVLRRL